MSHASGHSATILFKRSDSATAPATDLLAIGEPAYTFGTGTILNDGQKLFIGTSAGGSTTRGAIIGGEYFTSKMAHTPGQLAENAGNTSPYNAGEGTVVMVDSVGVIDKWKVDNLRFGYSDDNTITTSTGNLVLDAATDTIVFSGTTLDSIGSLIVDSATVNNLTITAGGNLTVPTFDVTDSAHIEFFSADSAFIDSARIDDLAVTNRATIDSAVINYIDAVSADIGNINISGTTIQSTTGSTLTINPFPVGDSGELVILGDLRVEGTTTTVNSTEVTISDKNLILGDDATNTSDLTGGGIQIGDSSAWGTTAPPRFEYYDPDSEFQINRDLHITGTSGTNGNITADSADFIILDVTGTSTLEYANIDSSHTNYADIDNAHIDSVDIDRLQLDSGSITNVSITYADIDSAHIDSAGIDRLQVDSANITNAIVDSAQINTLSATTVSFTNITGIDSAEIATLTVDSARFDILRITDSVGLSTMFDSTDFVFQISPNSPQVALKAEAIEDFVGAMVDSVISVQTNIEVRYDDSGGAIDFEVPFATEVTTFSSGTGIASGAGVAKFNDSDFRVTASTGYVEINQVDGGTF